MEVSGHLERKGDSKYTIVIDLGRDPITGKRRRKKKTVNMNQKKANKIMRDMMAKFEQGTFINSSNMTVGQAIEKWYEMYCLVNLQETTCENYRYIIDAHLLPHFSQAPVQQLEPFHIAEYLSEKKKEGLSNRSIQYHYTLLNSALKFTIKKLKVIKSNPCDDVDAPKKSNPKVDFLTPEQLAIFLNEAKKHNKSYAAAYMGAAHTGMRRGELLALTWDKVDFVERMIRVEESAAKLVGKGQKTKGTKTEKGVRTIPMTSEFHDFLKAHRKEQMVYMGLLGSGYKKNNLVFCKSNGEPLALDYASHLFSKIARKLGYKVTLHGMRHTFVSIMLATGVEINTIQEILGHEKPSTTYDIYGHLLPGKKKEAMQRFEAALGSSGHQTGTKEQKNRA